MFLGDSGQLSPIFMACNDFIISLLVMKKSKPRKNLHPCSLFFIFIFFVIFTTSQGGSALNTDGVILLSFKYAILSDPLSVLDSWNYDDQTPCSWKGVLCDNNLRVTALALPNSKLLGSIPTAVAQLDHLTHLDLSGNFFNGSLPAAIFTSPTLQVLSLSNNVISGEIPEGNGISGLRILNLSDNALAGKLPRTSLFHNLTVVSLRSNYFSGSLPGGGFTSVEVLDLSSNLLNGSLPADFQPMSRLKYLNLSYNKISGPIPPEFASVVPATATVDLSFNNLSGEVPQSSSLTAAILAGNADLCGKPVKSLCSIPSTLSSPPNVSTTNSPAAIAVIPKPDNSSPDTAAPATTTGSSSSSKTGGGGLKMGTIVGIVVGDLAGISTLALVIYYVYKLRKKKTTSTQKPVVMETKLEVVAATSQQEAESRKPAGSTWSCLTIKAEEIISEATSGSESDQEDKNITIDQNQANEGANQKVGLLVTVDGETEMELDRLLKASAYILGASGGSIVYKAVLENGMAYAVRRIGESGVERLKDFEAQVRAIGKLNHPNVVRVRGFYWGDHEKLLIYDYITNGTLPTFTYRRGGSSSPYHLPLETRIKIGRGVARGLAYIHDKKYVHGNIKPTNILLNSDMEPLITDLGLDRLAFGNQSRKLGAGSTRNLGSQRFMRDGPHESPSPYTPGSVSSSTVSPYQAPESLKNVKPNAKWDVYSFGVVLLELLTGRIFTEEELGQWTTTLAMIGSGFEDSSRVLRLVEFGLRGDVMAREELMVCLRLGFSCACLVPQKRPTMKEAQQVLDKIP